MTEGKLRDGAAGLVLVVFGGFFATYALAKLSLGSFAAMGPGMFPFLVGTTMAVIGIAQVAVTVLRPTGTGADDTPREPVEWRALLVVVVAMSAFAVTISYFGLLPAILVICLISKLASEKLSFTAALVLGVGLAVAAWVIFVIALGLPFTLFDWPF